MTTPQAASGDDHFPSGSWNFGPVGITWDLAANNEVDVSVTVLGISVDKLSGTINQQNCEIKDNINVLGIVTGTIGVKADYSGNAAQSGLWLEGQLTGPHFDTGPLNVRIVSW